jgi:FMN-dependent oxidoreductase (nitrilotriacetate monooxygenase family)
MSGNNGRSIAFGFFYHGVGTGQDQNNTWRNPAVPDDASINIRSFIEWAKKAEDAKLDFLFIADTPFVAPDSPPHYLDRLEPLTLLSALAVSTTNIGLVGTLTTSYNSPYNLARRVASLDLISGGRAGWNVVATGDAGASKNFGREEHYGYDERYPRALEHVRIVQGLWDTYEDDAFPKDAASGVFHLPEKQHRLDHRGEFFRVDGPLAIRRSAQGQPVLFQAGNSPEGRDLGAAISEGIFCHLASLEKAREFRDDLRNRALEKGRNPDDLRILPGVAIVIEDTDEAARARQSEINRAKDFDKELSQFGRAFAWHDFSQYDLDAPFPDVAQFAVTGHRSHADAVIRLAAERGLTLRETVLHYADRANPFAGSPQTVANTLAEWFLEGGTDGFIIQADIGTTDFDRFTNEVLPILRDRGLFRSEYESTTLRGNLGLPVPANRYASAEGTGPVPVHIPDGTGTRTDPLPVS